MYPESILQADEEGRSDAARSFHPGPQREKHHGAMFEEALKPLSHGEETFGPLVPTHNPSQPAAFLTGDRASLERLSPRQRVILRLIAESYNTKEIAGILEISIKTVETHRARLMDRLDIHDVAGLVRFAVKHGLVALDESDAKFCSSSVKDR